MWNENRPIYLQLKERVVGMMLDGLLKPGDALPSVRQVAARLSIESDNRVPRLPGAGRRNLG